MGLEFSKQQKEFTTSHNNQSGAGDDNAEDQHQQLMAFAHHINSAVKELPLISEDIKSGIIKHLSPLTRPRLKSIQLVEDHDGNYNTDETSNNTLIQKVSSAIGGVEISTAELGVLRIALELSKLSNTKLEQRLIAATKCNDQVTVDCALAMGAQGIKIGLDQEVIKALEHKADLLLGVVSSSSSPLMGADSKNKTDDIDNNNSNNNARIAPTTSTTTAKRGKLLPSLQVKIVPANCDNSAILCAIEFERDPILKKILLRRKFVEPLVHNGASNKSPLQLLAERLDDDNSNNNDNNNGSNSSKKTVLELFSLLLEKSRIHLSAEELTDLQKIGFSQRNLDLISLVEKEFALSASLSKRRSMSLFATAILFCPPDLLEQLIQQLGVPLKINVSGGGSNNNSSKTQMPVIEYACTTFSMSSVYDFIRFGLPSHHHQMTSNSSSSSFSSSSYYSSIERNYTDPRHLNSFLAPNSPASMTKKIRTLLAHGGGAEVTLGCLRLLFSDPMPDRLDKIYRAVLIDEEARKNNKKKNKKTASKITETEKNTKNDCDDDEFTDDDDEGEPAFNNKTMNTSHHDDGDKKREDYYEVVKEAYQERMLMLNEVASSAPETVRLEACQKLNVRALRDLTAHGFVVPFLTNDQINSWTKKRSLEREFLQCAVGKLIEADPVAANEFYQKQIMEKKAKNRSSSNCTLSASDLDIDEEEEEEEEIEFVSDDGEEEEEDEEYADSDDTEYDIDENGAIITEEKQPSRDENDHEDDDDDANDTSSSTSTGSTISSSSTKTSISTGGGTANKTRRHRRRRRGGGGPNSLRPEMKKMLQTVHTILMTGKEEIDAEFEKQQQSSSTTKRGAASASVTKRSAATSTSTSISSSSSSAQFVFSEPPVSPDRDLHQDEEFLKKSRSVQQKVLKDNLAVRKLGVLCEDHNPSPLALIFVLQQQNIGQRLLCQAAFGGYLEEMRTLVKVARVSPDMQFSADLGGYASRFTLLQMMVSMAANDTVKELLDCGANPNYSVTSFDRSMGSESALCVACERGDAEVTKMLLDAGADFEFKNYNGLTPLQIAGKGQKKECVSLIRQAKTERENKRKADLEAEKKAKREREEARRKEREEKQRELQEQKKKQKEMELQQLKEKEKEKEHKKRLAEAQKQVQQCVKNETKSRNEIIDERIKDWRVNEQNFVAERRSLLQKEEEERRSRERPCSCCQKNLTPSCFSKKQWEEKFDSKRVCNDCVAAADEKKKLKEQEEQKEKEKEKEKEEKQLQLGKEEANTKTKPATPTTTTSTTTTAVANSSSSTTTGMIQRHNHKNYQYDKAEEAVAFFERMSTTITTTFSSSSSSLQESLSEKLKQHHQQHQHNLAIIPFSYSEPTSPQNSQKIYQIPLACMLKTKGLLNYLESCCVSSSTTTTISNQQQQQHSQKQENDSNTNNTNNNNRVVAVCFDYSNCGECSWGEKCRFGHPISAKDGNDILIETCQKNKKFSKLLTSSSLSSSPSSSSTASSSSSSFLQLPSKWGTTFSSSSSLNNNNSKKTISTTTSKHVVVDSQNTLASSKSNKNNENNNNDDDNDQQEQQQKKEKEEPVAVILNPAIRNISSIIANQQSSGNTSSTTKQITTTSMNPDAESFLPSNMTIATMTGLNNNSTTPPPPPVVAATATAPSTSPQTNKKTSNISNSNKADETTTNKKKKKKNKQKSDDLVPTTVGVAPPPPPQVEDQQQQQQQQQPESSSAVSSLLSSLQNGFHNQHQNDNDNHHYQQQEHHQNNSSTTDLFGPAPQQNNNNSNTNSNNQFFDERAYMRERFGLAPAPPMNSRGGGTDGGAGGNEDDDDDENYRFDIQKNSFDLVDNLMNMNINMMPNNNKNSNATNMLNTNNYHDVFNNTTQTFFPSSSASSAPAPAPLQKSSRTTRILHQPNSIQFDNVDDSVSFPSSHSSNQVETSLLTAQKELQKALHLIHNQQQQQQQQQRRENDDADDVIEEIETLLDNREFKSASSLVESEISVTMKRLERLRNLQSSIEHEKQQADERRKLRDSFFGGASADDANGTKKKTLPKHQK